MSENNEGPERHLSPVPDLEADGYALPAEIRDMLTVRQQCGERETLQDESTVAVEAQAAVYGPREGDYGHPREDFTRTAIIWTGLLHGKLAEGEFIAAEDVPRLMVGLKLSRDVHEHKRDNRVDGIGYFITLDRLETGR